MEKDMKCKKIDENVDCWGCVKCCNCVECDNSSWCNNSTRCDNSSWCDNSTQCDNSTRCDNSTMCDNSTWCNDSTRCDNSTHCNNSSWCNNSVRCNNSTRCNNSSWCDNSTRCSNSAYCLFCNEIVLSKFAVFNKEIPRKRYKTALSRTRKAIGCKHPLDLTDEDEAKLKKALGKLFNKRVFDAVRKNSMKPDKPKKEEEKK